MTSASIRDRENWLAVWREFRDRHHITPSASAEAASAVTTAIDAAMSMPPEQFRAALTALDDADAEADRVGDPALSAEISVARAELLTERGEYDEAWGQLRRMRACLDRLTPPTTADASTSPANALAVAAPIPLLLGGELGLLRGAYAAAWTEMAEALEAMRAIGDTVGECRALAASSRIHFGLGNLDEAVNTGKTALTAMESRPPTNPNGQDGPEGPDSADAAAQVPVLLNLIAAEDARGEQHQATAWLDQLTRVAERLPLGRELVRATIVLARHTARKDGREAQQMLKRLADRLREVGAFGLAAQVQLELAWFAIARDSVQTALDLAVEALGAFMFLGHRIGQAAATQVLGDVFSALNVIDVARTRYEKALDMREAVDDHDGRISALRALARLTFKAGYFREAEGWLQDALEVAETAGAEAVRAALILDIGRIVRHQDRKAEARARFEEALAIRERLDDDLGRIAVFYELAALAEADGADDEAEDRLRAALRLLVRQGDDRSRGEVLARLADMRERRGDRNGAWQLFCEARDVFERLGAPAGTARVLKRLGDLRRSGRRYTDARDFYVRALDQLVTREPGEKAAIRGLLADAGACAFAESADNPALIDEAREFWQKALDLARELDDTAAQAATLVDLGIIALRTGEPELAHARLVEALDICDSEGNPAEAIRAHLALADLDESAARAAQAASNDPRPRLQQALDHMAQAYRLDTATHAEPLRSPMIYRRYQALLFELTGEHKARGDAGTVLKLLRVASDLARQQGDVRAAAAAAAGAGRVLAANGDREPAVPFFERARDLLAKVDDYVGASRSALELALLFKATNHVEAAWLNAALADVLLALVPEVPADEASAERAASGSSQFSRQPEILRRELVGFVEGLPTHPIHAVATSIRTAAAAFRDGDVRGAIKGSRLALETLAAVETANNPPDPLVARGVAALTHRLRQLLIKALTADGKLRQSDGENSVARSQFSEALALVDHLPSDSQEPWRAELEACLTAEQTQRIDI